MRTVLLSFFLLVCGVAHAQFTKIYDFDGSIGAGPRGPVIITPDDSLIYGITGGGGPTNDGIIYSLKTNGTGGQALYTFNSINGNGSQPHANLIEYGQTLYGVTTWGGYDGGGVVFSIHKDGSGFTKLVDTIGSQSYTSLTLSGNKIIGAAETAGADDTWGTLFSIDTNGNGYSVIQDFDWNNGARPSSDGLIHSGNIIYGTTPYGGASGNGVIFSINANGSGYTVLYSFTYSSGGGPLGTMALSGNTLYGCTNGGGLYGVGTIFSIQTNGSGYTVLHNFNTTDGSTPRCNLLLNGNKIYGIAYGGGTYNYGTLFSLNTDGSGFQVLHNFSLMDGTNGEIILSHSGTRLYGVAAGGGVNSKGTFFKFDLLPPPVPICMVTVDDSSEYNQVVWEKPITTAIDSFVVYREITSNNYKRLGAVAYSALSEFTDTVRHLYIPFTGDPNSGTYRYKLQVRDTAGVYSQLSPYHNTLYVTQNNGTFNWNHYIIEGDSIPLPDLNAYVLWRDDNSSGAWHSVQGVSGSQTTVTDPDYASYPNGRWRVETMWGITCTPSAKSPYNASRSNIKDFVPLGIETQLEALGIHIFPNPTQGAFTLTTNSNNIYEMEIYDCIGKKVYSTPVENSSTNFDLNLPAGLYFIQMKQESKYIGSSKLIITKQK
jgi:uncharacterized repeat protein (TIGR03803 family)